MLKKFYITLLGLFIFLTNLGCSRIISDRIEIDDLMLIRAIGIDKSIENPDNITLTILSKKVGEGQGGGSQDEGSQSSQSLILSDEAPTISQASRQFQAYTEKRIFWGHVDYYLIGEEAARDGIIKYLDYLIRDNDIRQNSLIYFIKDSTAKELIENTNTSDYFLPDRLESIGNNSQLYTGSCELDLLEFVQWLSNKYSSAVAPVLHLVQKEQKKEGEQPPLEMELYGYAIFKDLKLIHMIDKTPTRGINFLLNRVVTGIIEVKDPSQAMVALDIVNSNTKIKPNFKDDKLQSINVKVSLTSNINETHSKANIFTPDLLEILSIEQSNVIKDEIELVIRIAQEHNTDFIDMANVIGQYHPVKWSKTKDQWDYIFPTIPINVEVESKINRTYDIREPIDNLEGEHK